MVAVHTALLVDILAEVALAHRPFLSALGWTALGAAALLQGLRWWCVRAPGPCWAHA